MQSSDVIEAPDIQPADSARDSNWRKEYAAFMRILPELLKAHCGKYVAVHGGAVIAIADTFKDAAVQAYQQVGYVPLHVGLVSDAALQPVRIPSPRIKPALSA